MIEFMYTSKLPETKSADELLPYLATADKFQVPAFLEACLKALTTQDNLSVAFISKTLTMCEQLSHLDALKPLSSKYSDALFLQVQVKLQLMCFVRDATLSDLGFRPVLADGRILATESRCAVCSALKVCLGSVVSTFQLP